MTDESTLQAPAVEDGRSVGRRWLTCFGLAWFGFWLIVMLPGQFMTLKLAGTIDAAAKVSISSFLIAESSVIILATVPIIGWLCDRSSPRFGRRRTWALAGFIVAVVPFAFVGLQTAWPLAAVLLGIVAMGQATVLVSLSAVIADHVPVHQRGRASAAMGVPQVIALAGGTALVTEVVTDVAASWMLIAAIAFVSALPFLLFFREPASPPVARRSGVRRSASRAALAGYHDYGWAMLARVLINAGNLVGTTYLLFFLSDALRLADADTALLLLTLVYLLASGAASWIGGVVSDRWRSRRRLVALSAALQSAAALTLALSPVWPSAIVAAVLLGLGYGLFLSVDQALLTDVLPNPRTRARDLGIVNSAQHIPVAPLVGWLVLSIAGYTSLYVVAAVLIAIGGAVVYRIRSIR
ncbi:MFS transporter [Humibacter antri]